MSAPCPTFGFVVTLSIQSAQQRTVVDDFYALLERHGLDATKSDRSMTFTVVREGAQATHNDREVVREWAARWAEVATISIGELVDLEREM